MEIAGDIKREYHARKRILVTGGAGFVGSHFAMSHPLRADDSLIIVQALSGG